MQSCQLFVRLLWVRVSELDTLFLSLSSFELLQSKTEIFIFFNYCWNRKSFGIVRINWNVVNTRLI
jgi:hypothetical protein